MKPYTLPLSDTHANLKTVGGKGMSLAKLARAGLPVPGGFHITTEAYWEFVTVNNLQTKIDAALRSADPGLPSTLETASVTIGNFFAQAKIPGELANAIVNAYAELLGSNPAVAVRSSATAEDLPDASFAGQQETYLNISGADQVLNATKKCWASLWTARAIGYRAHQGIGAEGVALAVVVQLLVNAEAAGIMFTVNPINGNRDETVINAAWGLGEAVVGGAVTPDIITVNKLTGGLVARETAEKLVMTVRTDKGTEEQPVPNSLQKVPVLSDEQAARLARYGVEIEELYGMPMDIEWTLEDGNFAIVQARPITTLPEPPLKWVTSASKAFMARGSFAEFVPDPVSPLFATLAVPIAQDATQKMINDFIGITDEDSYLFDVVNGYVYVGIKNKYMGKMILAMLTKSKKVLQNSKERWETVRTKSLNVANKWKTENPAKLSPLELLAGVRELFGATAEYYTVAQSGAIPAASSSELPFSRYYDILVKRKDDPAATTFLLGFENLPLRAEKALYDLALWAKDQPELADYLMRTPAETVCAALQSEPVPVPVSGEFATRFAAYLAEFGHTLYDLDFAKPVPADDPAPLIDAIKVYLEGKGSNPHERQHAQIERREHAEQAITGRLGSLRRKWFLKLLKWAQESAPIREDCIADMGLGYPMLRRLLNEFGRRLVAGNVIALPKDIYWLEAHELDELAAILDKGEKLPNYAGHVEPRRTAWQRARDVTPPVTIPEKKWVSKLMVHDNPEGDTLKGYGASAGKATAPACVMRGPEDFSLMRPGDVIVAVTTTPAWTPLFAMASAVVTDIGGPLSHSSIVAREYGIPAVMATGVASKRIKTGQVITVDGTKGEVVLETSKENQPEQHTPPTEWPRSNLKYVYARDSLAEHLPNAVSPLFGTLGLQAINKSNTELGKIMNVDIRDMDFQYRVVNGYIYAGFLGDLKSTLTLIRLLFGNLKYILKGGTERWLEARKKLKSIIAQWDEKNPETLSPTEILEGVRELMYAAGKYYTVIQSGTLPSATTSEIVFTRVYKMVKRKDDPEAPRLLFGLDTMPLRVEKSLFDLGKWISTHPKLRNFTLHSSTKKLVIALQTESTPEAIPSTEWNEFKSRFNNHIAEFGHTSYEFDFMSPTPAETPELIIDAVKAYMEGKGSDPYTRQREVTEKRELTIKKIQNRFKLIPNRWFNKILKWAMDTGPTREDSIADMGMGHTTIRHLLGELGRRFAMQGAIERANDIYWLEEDEADKLASLLGHGEHLPDHKAYVSERKTAWHAQMKLTPPAVIPENSPWAKVFQASKENNSETLLKGLGASPGKVTATARVLFNPLDFNKMKQGDVLVAVITTPAWTPLFTLASAVVTDIGGPLSHSSIVAREYGIPAVLATGIGTRRIHDGQMITVDGGTGIVSLN